MPDALLCTPAGPVPRERVVGLEVNKTERLGSAEESEVISQFEAADFKVDYTSTDGSPSLSREGAGS